PRLAGVAAVWALRRRRLRRRRGAGAWVRRDSRSFDRLVLAGGSPCRPTAPAGRGSGSATGFRLLTRAPRLGRRVAQRPPARSRRPSRSPLDREKENNRETHTCGGRGDSRPRDGGASTGRAVGGPV